MIIFLNTFPNKKESFECLKLFSVRKSWKKTSLNPVQPYKSSQDLVRVSHPLLETEQHQQSLLKKENRFSLYFREGGGTKVCIFLGPR